MNNTSSKPVIVMGAGGHAKVLIESLKLSNREILGVVSPDLEMGEIFCEKKVLGNDSIIGEYLPSDIELVNGIGSLPRTNLRYKVATKMRNQGYIFSTVIHPSAIISDDIKLAEGVQIMAGVVIQPSVKIGIDSIINTGVLVDHDCNIADNCHLAPGVVCSGGVNIEERSHIGTGTVIIQGILICKDCVVAAGSTVYKNIPDSVNFVQLKQPKLTKIREG